MYPIGEKLVKSPKMKRDWKFSGQSWDSSKEDTWPKLFHYRVSAITHQGWDGHDTDERCHSCLYLLVVHGGFREWMHEAISIKRFSRLSAVPGKFSLYHPSIAQRARRADFDVLDIEGTSG